jgi:hypothetical protein
VARPWYRVPPLTCLAPHVLEMVLGGLADGGAEVAEMLGWLPLDGEKQRRVFAFR